MTTFAVTTTDQTLDSINYLLSNLGQSGNVGNVTIPTGTLIGNTTTGEVVKYNVGGNVYGYLYQYINLRYANNATGSSGFSSVPTNSDYFGVYNSVTSTASLNPTDYSWNQVAGGFGTTKTIYYSALGGRQVLFAAASSPPSSNYVVSTANVAIDLDVVTTAAGTPGERGPIPMGYVITTADPTSASSSTLTGWFQSSRENLTPPIGTGLIPVAGDTAYFTYPTTGASETYTFNGSAWDTAVGQVVSGATLVANSTPGTAITPASITGNRIANATLTGNLIVSSTITGNLIVPATLTGNLIAANTISATNILANTITAGQIAANTITANNIAANTITANNIAANTITSNQIAANTITANNILTGTITSNQIAANTITANNILTGTITSNQIAANTITANNISTSYLYTGNIVSFGANIGNNSSSGYWLQYNTGNARFGGNVSIGNSANIGSNLIVGNNAQIGGNLNVTGLVTAGTLVSNSVNTGQVVSAAISSQIANSTITLQTISNPDGGVYYPVNTTANITPSFSNQVMNVFAGCIIQFDLRNLLNNSYTAVILARLLRTDNVGAAVILSEQQFSQIVSGGGSSYQPFPAIYYNAIWPGYADTLPNTTPYRYSISVRAVVSGPNVTAEALTFRDRNVFVQSLKR